MTSAVKTRTGQAPRAGSAPTQTKQDRPLRRAVALLEVNRLDAAKAVATGVLALGSSIALAAVSAWLIARASQMPPVMYLTVATVAVRTFGVSRGVFRYLERLASHKVALSGMAQLRTSIYARLATGKIASTASLKRGDLLARVSADVDDVGDLVVKGLLPGAVAAVLSAATVVFIGLFHIPAALTLAVGILLAGALAPWLTQRAARLSEARSAAARSDLSTLSHELILDAAELRVRGDLPAKFGQLQTTEDELFNTADQRAKMEGWAEAVSNFALVFSALAAAVVAIPSVVDGSLDPVILAVIVLTPLAVFEVLQGLPAAAIQVHTSRQAAIRIMDLLDQAAPDGDASPQTAAQETRPSEASENTAAVRGNHLLAANLSCGWPARPGEVPQAPVLTGLSLDLTPGKSYALVGASGSGKTTTLMTLAGLLPVRAGSVTLDGIALDKIDHHELTRSVIFTSEDAHVFETTVLENLRVARGSVTPEQAQQVIEQAGLSGWVASLPEGIETVIGTNAATVSGGERRRLLLARALASDAPLLLLDEPAEHLDPATADQLLTDLLQTAHRDRKRAIVIATHRVTAMAAADEVLMLKSGRVVARGHHSELLSNNAEYQAAYTSQLRTELT